MPTTETPVPESQKHATNASEVAALITTTLLLTSAMIYLTTKNIDNAANNAVPGYKTFSFYEAIGAIELFSAYVFAFVCASIPIYISTIEHDQSTNADFNNKIKKLLNYIINIFSCEHMSVKNFILKLFALITIPLLIYSLIKNINLIPFIFIFTAFIITPQTARFTPFARLIFYIFTFIMTATVIFIYNVRSEKLESTNIYLHTSILGCETVDSKIYEIHKRQDGIHIKPKNNNYNTLFIPLNKITYIEEYTKEKYTESICTPHGSTKE